MKIAILGSGDVSNALAKGFLKQDFQVMRGNRDVSKLTAWKEKSGPKATVGTLPEAAKFGEVVILAVKGSAAESVVKTCGDALSGKVVLDTTNPIADKEPTEGVLHFFTKSDESLMGRLQKLAPKARFVKAFSCVGSALMVTPDFGEIRPTMFICGTDAGAKATAKDLLTRFGWDTEDMGGIEAARAIEPLCLLWCIPGFRENRWSHAFKLLKK